MKVTKRYGLHVEHHSRHLGHRVERITSASQWKRERDQISSSSKLGGSRSTSTVSHVSQIHAGLMPTE